MQKNEQLGIALLATVAFIWGTGFLAAKIAIDSGYTPSFIMMVRFVTAALCMLVILHKHVKGVTISDLIAGGLVGSFLFLGFTLQTYGLTETSPSNSAFITATKVPMVPLLCWILHKEKPSKRIMGSVAISLVGITVLSMDLQQGFSSFGYGELLTFLCALSFAFHTICTGYFVRKTTVQKLVVLQLIVAASLSTLLVLFSSEGIRLEGSLLQGSESLGRVRLDSGFFAILYLGVLATGVAYVLQTVGQKYVTATQASLVIATESLFASIFSVILGFEVVSFQLLLGGMLILCSIGLIQLGKRSSR